MAEQDPPQDGDLTTTDESSAAEGGVSLLGRLKVLGFVVIVIVVECLVAFLWLPSAEETAAEASSTFQGGAEGDVLLDQGTSAEEEKEVVDQIEVDMGEFSISAFQPISNTTLRIDFHLFGTVVVEDEKDFLLLMEENLHRFREQVIVAVRSADIGDLTDAGLGLIKRKILEKTNRTLGKPLLRTVIFSEFSFVEQ